MLGREVWLKVIYTGAVELVGTQPRSLYVRPPPAAFRRLCNIPITALHKTRHWRDFPLHPRQSVIGLYQCAMGRLIYGGDIFKGKIRTITVSVAVLSQQNSPLMNAEEAKRRM